MYHNYQDFFSGLKLQIQEAKVKVVLTANSQLLELYWKIGKAILDQQNLEGWGTKVIQKLSFDLKEAFPELKGLSERNLKYMRAFAEAYPDFVQAGLAQNTGIGQAELARIPWYHHITLLDKLRDENIRNFYIQKTIENGWSRNVMVHQIESGLHQRLGKLQHNFTNTLPAVKGDLARELFKDPYKFDFFQLTEEASERDLEDALINNIYKFLLEMGKGFAFMGRQVHLEKGGQDYYLDLLFYHTKLHCHVILELKIGDFKPEFAGKMNFYLSAFDDEHRGTEDGPSIGIILCKSKNKVTAEYALRDVHKPMGIAEYNLTAAIPADLQAELPSIEDLEIELEKDLTIPRDPLAEKLSQLNELVSGLGHREVKLVQSREVTEKLFFETVSELKSKVAVVLEPVFLLFKEASLGLAANGRSSPRLEDIEPIFKSKENIYEIGIHLTLTVFLKGGLNTFNRFFDLKFFLEQSKYLIGTDRQNIWEEHLYDQIWTDQELQRLANTWASKVIDEVLNSIERLK